MNQETGWSHHAYSWHQSHDQATVLLTVPADVVDADVEIKLEREYIVAGVKGHDPIVKGKLYGPVDPNDSVWQLEPGSDDQERPPRDRIRTASVTSTVSSQSSYAYVSSDPDISSSLAASMEHLSASSDWDNRPERPDPSSSTGSYASSPYSSPRVLSTGDEELAGLGHMHHIKRSSSGRGHPSPLSGVSGFSGSGIPSSYASSVDSLHGDGGERLLTLHLEKIESSIWPTLISGPVQTSMSPSSAPLSMGATFDPTAEDKYNMDPTSLTLTGLELYDIRRNPEEAFGYFVRAWRHSHVPTAALRLVTHYVPPLSTAARPGMASSSFSRATGVSALAAAEMSTPGPLLESGSTDFYVHMIGGPHSLAQLYLEVGVLHLDGVAPALLAASSSAHSLSSLRLPALSAQPGSSALLLAGSTQSPEQWRSARQQASRCFDRARALWPQLDVPVIPPEPGHDSSETIGAGSGDLQMPTLDMSGSYGSASEDETVLNPRPPLRRRRTSATESGSDINKEKRKARTPPEKEKERGQERLREKEKETVDLVSSRTIIRRGAEEHPWYLYAPGIIGAGTALAAVAVVGAISLSTWRRGQN